MKKEFMRLLDNLISFKTTKDKPVEIDRCLEYIETYFEDEKDIVIDRFEKDGVNSITLNFKEYLKPDIILLSHIDVVPAMKEMFKMKVDKNLVFGRGVSDMKGMVVLGMLLMKKYAKLDKKPSFGLVITSDEEQGGFNGAGYLVNNKLIKPRVAIVPDGGDNFQITNVEKGIIHLKLSASGVSAHGSRPWLGKNAVDILIDNYLKMRKLFREQKKEGWYKTINIGKLFGGEATNKVPDFAECFIDIRYTEKDNPQKLIDKIKKMMSKEITIDVLLCEPLCYTSKNDKFLQNMKTKMRKMLNEKILFSKGHGGSDARFFTKYKIPSIIVKPKAGGQHGNSEWLNIDSSIKFFDILDSFIVENGTRKE